MRLGRYNATPVFWPRTRAAIVFGSTRIAVIRTRAGFGAAACDAEPPPSLLGDGVQAANSHASISGTRIALLTSPHHPFSPIHPGARPPARAPGQTGANIAHFATDGSIRAPVALDDALH